MTDTPKSLKVPAALPALARIVVAIPFWFGCAILFTLMCMTFTDVILRSVFNNPIAAAAELTEIAVGIVVFTALPVVSYERKQIAVDLLDSLYSPTLARLRDAVIDILCGALLYWPISRVYVLAERAGRSGSRTEFLEIPTQYVSYFIFCMLCISAVTLILRGLLGLFRSGPDRPDASDNESALL